VPRGATAPARGEVALHAAREATYAALFLALAWFASQGALAAVIGALLVGEVVITLRDELVENRIRVLPQNERALLVPALLDWGANPTELAPAHHGWMSWALTFLGLGSAWSIRDAVAARQMLPARP
jgi:uncharacterized protein